MDLKQLFAFLPEVKKPAEKKLSFNLKLKWTLFVLGAFFVLANIPLFGLAKNSLERFEYLAIILGTDFGSIISLGIGPIVMASIILQLLVGAGILTMDLHSHEGRRYYQGIQKIAVLFFIVFEAMIYVLMQGLQAMPGFTGIVILQLVLGGIVIMLMDEVTTKWGFGSGVSLFIVAGVAWRLFSSLFQFIGPTGQNCLLDFSGTPCAGKLLVILQSIINGTPAELILAVAAIVATAVIFLAVIWAQSLKVEIPLGFAKIRGYSMKWPLQFFYASVIPVILVSALSANIQLFGGLLEGWLGHPTFLGEFSQGQAIGGLAFWLTGTNIVEAVIRNNLQTVHILQSFTYLLYFMLGSALFSVLWIKTNGQQDESAQAKNIIASGLQLPGFRKDPRILEAILKRYILPLTVMGGISVGLLAAVSDLLGALTSGTSILLAIMIMYQFYQNIAQQHAVDMHPALRKLAG